MFGRKKQRTTPYFVFNYSEMNQEKCIALSVENGYIYANWFDSNGNRHCYKDVAVTESFWQALADTVTESGMLGWKAHKLCTRFVSDISSSVFNAEGLFPNGQQFAANNMHGLPEGFEEATETLLSLFANMEN